MDFPAQGRFPKVQPRFAAFFAAPVSRQMRCQNIGSDGEIQCAQGFLYDNMTQPPPISGHISFFHSGSKGKGHLQNLGTSWQKSAVLCGEMPHFHRKTLLLGHLVRGLHSLDMKALKNTQPPLDSPLEINGKQCFIIMASTSPLIANVASCSHSSRPASWDSSSHLHEQINSSPIHAFHLLYAISILLAVMMTSDVHQTVAPLPHLRTYLLQVIKAKVYWLINFAIVQ